jgi:hypothetical protein
MRSRNRERKLGRRDAFARAPVMALFLVREVEVLLGSSVKDPKPNPTASS